MNILNTTATNTVIAITATPNTAAAATTTAWWGWCPRCFCWFDSHRIDCAGAAVAALNETEEGPASRAG